MPGMEQHHPLRTRLIAFPPVHGSGTALWSCTNRFGAAGSSRVGGPETSGRVQATIQETFPRRPEHLRGINLAFRNLELRTCPPAGVLFGLSAKARQHPGPHVSGAGPASKERVVGFHHGSRSITRETGQNKITFSISPVMSAKLLWHSGLQRASGHQRLPTELGGGTAFDSLEHLPEMRGVLHTPPLQDLLHGNCREFSQREICLDPLKTP